MTADVATVVLKPVVGWIIWILGFEAGEGEPRPIGEVLDSPGDCDTPGGFASSPGRPTAHARVRNRLRLIWNHPSRAGVKE